MYNVLLNLFSVVGFVAIFVAALGVGDQFRTNWRNRSTEGIEPYRFGALALSNLAWVAWSVSTEEISWPLLLGCGLFFLFGCAIAGQVLLLPPLRSKFAVAWCGLVILAGGAMFCKIIADRELVRSWNEPLQWISVTSSILLLHLFTVKQWWYTRSHGIHGVSRNEVVSGFLNWAVFLPYPVALLCDPSQSFAHQFDQYWAMLLNTICGLVTSGMRLTQYYRFKKGGAG